MFEFNVGEETYVFIIAIVNGIGLGLIYDINRIVRVYSKSQGIRLMLEDLLFWIITAYVFFLFTLRTTNGIVRGYIVLGFTLGFFIYIKSISKYIFKLLNKIFKLIFQSISEIIKLIVCPFRKLKLFFKRRLLKWLGLPKIILKEMKGYYKIISKKK